MLIEKKTKDQHNNIVQHYYEDEQGRRQGEWKDYYCNGLMWGHCWYKDDDRHGERRLYWENGTLRLHAHYKNDRRHGEYKLWTEEGQLWEHTFYKDDKAHGQYHEYAITGRLLRRKFFQNNHDISDQVKPLIKNAMSITKEEQAIIMLKFNIKCLTS